ncbi:MAG: lysostaphin resistance A-like protein [Shimia sp.]
MSYAPFDPLRAAARERGFAWRTLAGLVACFLAGLAGVFAVGYAATGLVGMPPGFLAEMARGERPGAALALLATFLGMAAGPLLAVWLLHRRPVATLWGAGLRRDFVSATAIGLGIGLATMAVAVLAFDVRPNLDPVTWALLLPAALILVAIQTGAEELLFRGYLQQQLGAYIASPLAWMVLPSLTFGALHISGDLPPANAAAVFAATSLFGIVAADLTARTGGIGAAWGLHFANNVQVILILSAQGPLSGLALFHAPFTQADPGLWRLILLDMVLIVAIWAAWRRWRGV